MTMLVMACFVHTNPVSYLTWGFFVNWIGEARASIEYGFPFSYRNSLSAAAILGIREDNHLSTNQFNNLGSAFYIGAPTHSLHGRCWSNIWLQVIWSLKCPKTGRCNDSPLVNGSRLIYSFGTLGPFLFTDNSNIDTVLRCIFLGLHPICKNYGGLCQSPYSAPVCLPMSLIFCQHLVALRFLLGASEGCMTAGP